MQLIELRLFIALISMTTLCPLTSGKCVGQEFPRGKNQAKDLNTKEEEAIRKAIYGKGLTISHNRIGSHVYSVVVVPEEIKKAHVFKKVALLKLLLDIVKGGRPEDALSAAGYAVALEENPGSGVYYAQCPPESFDEVENGQTQTQRRRVLGWLVIVADVKAGP